MKDARGHRIRELLNHVFPASLFLIRLNEMHSCCHRDGVVLHGDVKNVYVKAALRGEEVWVTLPERCRPASHSRYRVPVVRLRKALYGLRLAGLDSESKVRRDMTGR